MEEKVTKLSSIKTIFWGIIFTGLGALFWYGIGVNPVSEYKLIVYGKTTDGFITECFEDTSDNDRGQVMFFHSCNYSYKLIDGRHFGTRTIEYSGRLKDDLVDLKEPYPVKVIYYPDDPEISKIEGSGSNDLFDWAWRKVGLGIALLLMFTSPGFIVLKGGIKDLYRIYYPLPKHEPEPLPEEILAVLRKIDEERKQKKLIE